MNPDDRLKELINEHSGLIGAAIQRVCAKKYGHVVDDVRQDVYVALWKQLESGKNIEHPVSYIYKVALTTALATVKRLVRERDVIAEAGLMQERLSETGNPVPDDLDRKHRLESALGELDSGVQSAVRAYLVGFNHVEVAELLSISKSSARHAIYRGIAQLKSSMARLENESDD